MLGDGVNVLDANGLRQIAFRKVLVLTNADPGVRASFGRSAWDVL